MGERTVDDRPPDAVEATLHIPDPPYRALFSFVRDAIIVANAETGMLVDANPAAEALIGRSVSEIRELHHSQLHPSDDAEKARDEFDRFTRERTSYRGPRNLTGWHILHSDGRRIPVDILSTVWTEGDGPALVFGIFRDATERHAAAEALRRSEERFRQIAELAGEFIWEVDAEGLYTFASPVVEQALGYKPEEVVGKMHFYDFFVPETREQARREAFEVFEGRTAFRGFRNLNVRKDGSVVVLETAGLPIFDRSGAFVGYRGADRDVTERERAEALLRAVMDSSPDPILVKDRNSRLLLASPAALRIFDKPAVEVLGRTDEEIFADPAEGRQLMANDRQVMDTGQARFVEELVHAPDGPRVFLSGKAPHRDATGSIVGVVCIARDITLRKRAEEALRNSELKYRRLHESITDALVTVDMAGHILEFNPAYEAMLGYAGDELRRLSYRQLTPERLACVRGADYCGAGPAGRTFTGLREGVSPQGRDRLPR